MRILINDFKRYREDYTKMFESFEYEKNELIFCEGITQTKEFIANQLEGRKLHIDLMITNDSREGFQFDILKCSELSFFKNTLAASFSKGNFRISSIPLILYSANETKQVNGNSGFTSIVQKNTMGNHGYFIRECEAAIRAWRKLIIEDLDFLDIAIDLLDGFVHSGDFKHHYKGRILRSPEFHFAQNTKVVSLEFIKYPMRLIYDWLTIPNEFLEKAVEAYAEMYKRHKKYDSKNNERTIIHNFFNKNRIILLRDTYVDFQYETNLYELNGVRSEECDYILKTDFPEYLNTTFFEVKKEDVKFFSNKKRKRPSLNRKFQDHLDQLWQYRKYSQNQDHQGELTNKLGYKTNKFDYTLLAGRRDEKEEFEELFKEKMADHYNGISVLTFEELEDRNVNYLQKRTRVKI